jgi:hypothetical protein
MIMRISLRPLCRVRPLPRIKLRVSRRNGAGRNPENGVKRRHRIKPTIETEHVFVEVCLQVFGLDTAMMRAFDPCFQVAENEMDHRQVRLSFVGVSAERQCLMAVSHLGKAGVASPAICAYRGTKRHVFFDKAGKRIGAAVRHDTKPQSSRIDAVPVLLTVILTRPNLYSTNHDRLVMCAATFASRLAADQAFINFDRMLAANGVALGANHTGAELMEYLKGRLVATESKLPLELDGGLSGDLRGHEIRAPKPRRERRMARLHDGTGRQRRIGLAGAATQHHRRAGSEAIWLADNSTLRARKAIRPPNGFKVASASRIIGKYPLKLRKRSWEAANVHVRDNRRILSLCQATV